MPLTLLLLVEDDARQSDALRSLFEESFSDIKVHVAKTLEEAQTHEKNVDAVLLDLDLPDSHGLSTLTSVLDRFAPVPVIVLTAATDPSIAEQAISLGADDYLQKALIPPAAIHRVVRYAMRHSRERVAAAE